MKNLKFKKSALTLLLGSTILSSALTGCGASVSKDSPAKQIESLQQDLEDIEKNKAEVEEQIKKLEQELEELNTKEETKRQELQKIVSGANITSGQQIVNKENVESEDVNDETTSYSFQNDPLVHVSKTSGKRIMDLVISTDIVENESDAKIITEEELIKILKGIKEEFDSDKIEHVGFFIIKNCDFRQYSQETKKLLDEVISLMAARNLRVLDLRSLNLTDNDISFNYENNQIHVLYIADNNFTTLEFLKQEGWESLTWLDIQENRITDISALENLSNLESINVSNNSISDISALENLSNLESIHASNNSISDISVLANHMKIEHINVENNLIEDINLFVRTQKQNRGEFNIWLFITNNHITDFSYNEILDELEEKKINDMRQLVDNIKIKKYI